MFGEEIQILSFAHSFHKLVKIMNVCIWFRFLHQKVYVISNSIHSRKAQRANKILWANSLIKWISCMLKKMNKKHYRWNIPLILQDNISIRPFFIESSILLMSHLQHQMDHQKQLNQFLNLMLILNHTLAPKLKYIAKLLLNSLQSKSSSSWKYRKSRTKSIRKSTGSSYSILTSMHLIQQKLQLCKLKWRTMIMPWKKNKQLMK